MNKKSRYYLFFLILLMLLTLIIISCYNDFNNSIASQNLEKATECQHYIEERYGEKVLLKDYPTGIPDRYVAHFVLEDRPEINFAVWYLSEGKFYDEYLSANLLYDAEKAINELLLEHEFANSIVNYVQIFLPAPADVEDVLYSDYYLVKGGIPQLSEINRDDFSFNFVLSFDNADDVEKAKSIKLDKKINEILPINGIKYEIN